MDPILTIIFVLVALVIGAILGWFASGRTAAPLRDENKRLREEGETTVGTMRLTLDGVTKERDTAQLELSALKAQGEERERAFEARLEELREAKEALTSQFSEVGSKLLGEAQKAFLERADARFNQAGEKNEEKLKQLLNPVGERLKAYEEQVGKIEKERTEAYGNLAGLMQQMREGQEDVRREAQRLGNSLTNAPKARGRWGERALQNVLEQSGLSEHTDFDLEQSLETGEGRLRPDAIINVPGQKKLIVDAKVSLNAYQAAFEADDEDQRKQHLDLHAKSMRNHVQTLGAKSYQSQFDEAPDYVVMFVPGEHFVAAALEQDPELWDFAFEKRVLLASPTNLVAIARTVAQVWRQDRMANEAQEIGRMGAELYDRLRVAADHLKRMGGGLDTAVKNYNKFVGSFERNVLSSGKRMAEKGIEVGKREIEEVPLVEATPTYGIEDAAAIED